MSTETTEWLYTNVLAGYSKERTPWWYAGPREGILSPLYDGPIPISEVKTRLFGWEPVEGVMKGHLPDGRSAVVVGRKTIHRSDTGAILGTPSVGYQLHGYGEWLIDNVGLLLDDGGLHIGSAGLLKGGAVAWVQIELGEDVTTKHGVTFRPRLLACTSFDSTLPSTEKLVNGIVVCDNTMTAALGEKGVQKYQVKHTKNSKFDITSAREALDLVIASASDFEREVEALCKTRITNKVWDEFVNTMFPLRDTANARVKTITTEKRDMLQELRDSDERVSPWRNTAFAAVQAWNTYKMHLSLVQEKRDQETDTPNRFETKWLDIINDRSDEADLLAKHKIMSLVNATKKVAPAKALVAA